MGVDNIHGNGDSISAKKIRIDTAIGHIQRIEVGDIGSVFNRMNDEKRSEVHGQCGVQIRTIVASFRKCKVSGRLPAEIVALAEYGLSVIPNPNSQEVEEVTFAAAKHVLGDNYEFYKGFVDRDLADLGDLSTGVDAVRDLIKQNQ